MAAAFHSTCRLTFIGQDGVVVIPQHAFCDKVQNRYSDLIHEPYAALNDHPNVERHDTLLATEFVAPDLCLVTLKVGHPPRVWTDFLVCAKLAEGRWWIVHKASCNEEFELTDEMKKVLEQRTSKD